MAKKRGAGISRRECAGMSRREFLKLAGTGVLAAGVGDTLLPRPARAQGKTLKIMQWSHFVPGYDKWFDGVFCKQWGDKHGTHVTVDHIAIGEVNARAAASEASRRACSGIRAGMMWWLRPAVYLAS